MDKKFHDNSQLSIYLKIRDHHDLSNLEEGRWIVTKLTFQLKIQHWNSEYSTTQMCLNLNEKQQARLLDICEGKRSLILSERAMKIPSTLRIYFVLGPSLASTGHGGIDRISIMTQKIGKKVWVCLWSSPQPSVMLCLCCSLANSRRQHLNKTRNLAVKGNHKIHIKALQHEGEK